MTPTAAELAKVSDLASLLHSASMDAIDAYCAGDYVAMATACRRLADLYGRLADVTDGIVRRNTQ